MIRTPKTPDDAFVDHQANLTYYCTKDGAVLAYMAASTYSCNSGYISNDASCNAPALGTGMSRTPETADNAFVDHQAKLTYSCIDGYTAGTGNTEITCNAGTFPDLGLTCTQACKAPTLGTGMSRTPVTADDAFVDHQAKLTYSCMDGYTAGTGNAEIICNAGTFPDLGLTCTLSLKLVGTHVVHGGETQLLCTLDVGTVDDDAVTWSKGGSDLTDGSKYSIANHVGDTFTLTVQDTQSTDAGEYKCSYKTQTSTYNLNPLSIQALDITAAAGKSLIKITFNSVRPQSPVINVMLDETSIPGTINPDPPVDTGDSFTYKTVWTSTERLLKGTYSFTVTNGADMSEVGTLEVTECADFYFDDCSKACTCVQDHFTSCDDATGLCTCKTGWIGTDCGQDKNECDDPNPCPKENDHCNNLDATFECVCNLGYHTVDDECKKCEDFKYGDCTTACACSSENADSCDHVSGSCTCKTGWRGPDCTQDINECTEETHDCGEHFHCVNKNGTFDCKCDDGYVKENGVCNKCDSMKYGTDCANDCTCVPGNTNECDNEFGTCDCKDEWTGQNCEIDVNECTTETHNCATAKPNSHCFNEIGSFLCVCNDGYKTSDDKLTCTECDSSHYGNECLQTCACTDTNKKKCNAIDGACSCDDGWQGDTCMENKDECVPTNPCGDHGTCSDTIGGYSCACNAGYKATARETYGTTCTECDAAHFGDGCTSECTCISGNTQDCDHVTGACSCNQGWRGGVCETDIDECATNDGDCPEHSVCVNKNGTHDCNCNAGFEKLENGTCVACDSTHYGQNCADACQCNMTRTTDCSDVDGSCVCMTGWSGDLCNDDVNECTATPTICDDNNAVCSNNDGGYDCTCTQGWAKDSNNKCNDRGFVISYIFEIDEDLTQADVKTQVKNDILQSLIIYFKSKVVGFKSIIILGIRSGSVIVDYLIETVDTVEAQAGVASAIQDSVTGTSKIVYKNNAVDVKSATITKTVDDTETNTTFTKTAGQTDLCQVFLSMGPCDDNKKCTVENGVASCRTRYQSAHGGAARNTHWQSIGRVFDPNMKYEIRRPKLRKDPQSIYSH
ncbi:hypothetical protein ScPMuIL_003414 [Solemya velum]